MVRTLVLTIDRDNDLGVKAGIRGPVVGRKSTLTAALRLGIADPEESDTNAILGALHHHDRIVERAGAGDEVEIAILTGDVRVGPRSDRAIASQLDEVIQEFQPDSALLVTDGADDEASLPIVTSRIRVDTVEKVIVRQSKGIEGTYYYIIKAVEDPRFRAKLLVPLSIFLMIIGLGLILPNGIALIGALPLFIGIWLLGKGLGWEQQMERLMIDMRESATGGLFSSLLWGLSIVTTLLAILLSYQKLTGPLPEGSAGSDLLLLIVLTLDDVLPWILISLFSFALSLGILRWKEGTFTGRSVLLLGLSGVIYSFADAILGVSERVLEDGEYLPEISTVSQDWSLPLLSVILYYLLKQVVQSFSDEEDMDAGNRFWGV
jgi:putative membrane protein